MRRALQALFLCLAILSGIVGTASGAHAPMGSKNRVGVPGPNPDIRTYVLGSLELEPQGGDTILGYDPATGVVFYVNQNPWSKFDPTGLEGESTASRVRARIGQIIKAFVGDPGPADNSPSSRLDNSWMNRAQRSANPLASPPDSPEQAVDDILTIVVITGAPMATRPPSRPASSPKPTGGVISGVVDETPAVTSLETKVKSDAKVAAVTPEAINPVPEALKADPAKLKVTDDKGKFTGNTTSWDELPAGAWVSEDGFVIQAGAPQGGALSDAFPFSQSTKPKNDVPSVAPVSVEAELKSTEEK